MDSYATANASITVNAEAKAFADKREIITKRVLAADFESGLFTQADAPTVTSFGNGKLTTRGRSKVWYCCACGDGGMSVTGYGDCCPSCGHQKCGCCTEQKVRTHSK